MHSPHVYLNWYIHHMCTSIDTFTTCVPQLIHSPHVYLNWYIHHMCTSMDTFTTFVPQWIHSPNTSYINIIDTFATCVPQLIHSPHVYLNWYIHHLCTSIDTFKFTHICLPQLIQSPHLCLPQLIHTPNSITPNPPTDRWTRLLYRVK
jgi:hypothetical protein